MAQKIIFILVTVLLSGAGALVFAQNNDVRHEPSDERSSFEERRKSIMDANTLRATYHNYGFAGRTSEDNRDELYFEFPKNTNRRYIYFISIFTGAEVENQQTGAKVPIVVAPNYRTNPQTGDSWAKNPIVGYFNPDSDELARSDRGPDDLGQNTWPRVWPDKMDDTADPGWPDSWNGFFGKDIFNADMEMFYRSGDDLYTRFSQDGRWLPDPDDPSRGGLGLIMDTRILSWTQNLISSVHFNVFEIRNDSRFDYEKVSFMLWTADWVGTPQNDEPFFDQQRSVAFFTTDPPTNVPAEFDGIPAGVAGIRFLETPGNAIDGIDNDGDSDFYFPGTPEGIYDSRNADLYTPLTVAGGGFISDINTLSREVVPQFTAEDFQERFLSPGDPIVLIDDNDNRILMRYPPDEAFGENDFLPVITQGREFLLERGGMHVREDTARARHLNLLDDDLNGLIDENQPNHLTLTSFIRGRLVTRPVRYINYTWDGFFNGHNGYPGIGDWSQDDQGNWKPDSMLIQRGLVIPDKWLEKRMSEDFDFRKLILDYQESLKDLYSRQPATPIFPESFFNNYYMSIHTTAPMIDESREDFFDNTQTWEPQDDVGIDGVQGSGSRGEGSGFPSSGAFTPFPGEPNIDKTDVRETDAIGISSATFRPAGGLGGGSGFRGDLDIWRNNMVPGIFQLAPDKTQDTDQFITSSFFPLRQGSTERFAIAVTIAQTGTPNNVADIELVTQQLENAFSAYDANYQFAIAPPPPHLTAVPGDGRITLYWDDEAEFVFDRYLERIGANPENFEGYKIYRTTDPALADARRVTDGRGNIQFLKPIAQFDLDNGIKGNHPIDINGHEFYLGDDTGIRRSYVDTDVINGRKYYYAVVAYNSGATEAGIAPSESPISLSIQPDGTLIAGRNVKEIIPRPASAGYIGPEPLQTERISGQGTGSVFADIIDPRVLKPDRRYRLEFQSEEATVVNGMKYQRTTGYRLYNVTDDILVLKDRDDLDGEEVVFDGIKLTVINDFHSADKRTNSLNLLSWKSGYGSGQKATVRSKRFVGNDRDYVISFHNRHAPARRTQEVTVLKNGEPVLIEEASVAFTVFDAKTGWVVPFAYEPSLELQANGRKSEGSFAAWYNLEDNRTYSDFIYILETDHKGNNMVSWQLHLEPYEHNTLFEASPGDELILNGNREFTEDDVFEFFVDATKHIPSEDKELARQELDNIRVVPNPYIVTNITEPRPTPANPTQARQLHFTNLPAQCTIRIFTVSGRLVQTLNVNNSIDNDRYIWDMLTMDNLELSYGIYIYHVTAPGVGEKVGKFAVIK